MKRNIDYTFIITFLIICVLSACNAPDPQEDAKNNLFEETLLDLDGSGNESTITDTSPALTEEPPVDSTLPDNEPIPEPRQLPDNWIEIKNTLITEMIRAFCSAPDSSYDRIEEILEELALYDEETSLKWRDVMDYWNYTRNELEINCDALPSGLADTDKLCFVVLGFQLNSDGSIRNELAGRLQTVLSCAENYPHSYILCTGGGTASRNPSVTEAGQMAKWLMEKGVDPDRIIIEDRSLTTGQNALFSYEILKRDYPSVDQVVIVSSDYHVPSGAMLFQAAFILGNDDGSPVSVVSNAAYVPAARSSFPLRFQAAGLLEVAGLNEAAEEAYRDPEFAR